MCRRRASTSSRSPGVRRSTRTTARDGPKCSSGCGRMPKKRIEQSLTSAALLFAALGDPTRLALVQRLSDGGPASISMLAENFQVMTRQGVTKHLQVLAAAGVIDGSRLGREQVWTVNAQ